MLVEVGLEDLQRRRRGRFGAEAAFLGRHRGDDTGVGIRGQDHVPGLVAVAGPFRRAGLAGDRHREAAEDAVGGAAGGLRGLVQAFQDRVAVDAVDVDVATGLRGQFLQHPAGGVLDFHPHVRRHHGAAVGDRRVGDRHLQRVRLQVALPGGQLDVVAGRPGPFGFAFLVELVAPLLARHQAFGLLRQVDPGGTADPQLARPALQFAAVPHLQPELVEVDVGGGCGRAR